jgi:hypothetical protein
VPVLGGIVAEHLSPVHRREVPRAPEVRRHLHCRHSAPVAAVRHAVQVHDPAAAIAAATTLCSSFLGVAFAAAALQGSAEDERLELEFMARPEGAVAVLWQVLTVVVCRLVGWLVGWLVGCSSEGRSDGG